ncbi:hypothetical protein EDB81DRAFT_758360 [Dactylonectria macrodidyma]|uniref:Uncharacterized protein n=1 Tax=Dactylonectria macrodidyma TaxID=307937 RepID=A0A9P9F4C0_9HYPO|nr:hypothetical protein EDB81DRAFT_758360 [Dactylonectria macrodidyma]
MSLHRKPSQARDKHQFPINTILPAMDEVPVSARPLVREMMSPHALAQGRRLLQLAGKGAEVGFHAILPPFDPKAHADWFAMAVRVVEEISFLTRYQTRNYQLHLFDLVEYDRVHGISHSPGDELDLLVQRHGLTWSALEDYINKGRKIYEACGGHMDLLFILPLEVDGNPEVSPTDHLFELDKESVNAIGNQLKQKSWVKSMCALGQQINQVVVKGAEPFGASAALKASTDTFVDEEISENGMKQLLDGLQTGECACPVKFE